MSEPIYWTVIRVTYGDGSVFEGNEINVALVSGYTGKERGGEVKREYLERMDPAGERGTSRWKGEGTPVERLEVIASDIRGRIMDSTSPVSLGFVQNQLWKRNEWQGMHKDALLRPDAKYMGAPLSEVVAYMNWRGI
jgi:hypothetical protein